MHVDETRRGRSQHCVREDSSVRRDHSEVGSSMASAIARRIGLDPDGVADLVWLVQHHLLLAETATRRDLGDETTIQRFADSVGDRSRLRLLYALTVADSRATGPAAWSEAKATLLRELFLKTERYLEQGAADATLERTAMLRARIGEAAGSFVDSMPPGYVTAFPTDVVARHYAMLARRDGRLQCTAVAQDRIGLLADVAGALALTGFDIASASAYSSTRGMALEVFTGIDRFGRLTGGSALDDATALLSRALEGDVELEEALRARMRRYRRRTRSSLGREVSITVDQDASATATVVEVHAPDAVGLLARVAATFADLGIDVATAIVATLGDRVIDTFYVRDSQRAKLTDERALEHLRTTLSETLTQELAER